MGLVESSLWATGHNLIMPQAERGMLIAFPASLLHLVRPPSGSVLRFSISFNIISRGVRKTEPGGGGRCCVRTATPPHGHGMAALVTSCERPIKA